MVKLYLSNEDLYNELLPAEPVVELSGVGKGVSEQPQEDKADFDPVAEAERLAKLV
jgi:hypothetical protein